MTQLLTLAEVLARVGASPDFVVELERESIVVCTEGRYTLAQVDRIRVCWNLHHHLGVNLAGIDVALSLLDRLEGEREAQRQLLQRLARARRS